MLLALLLAPPLHAADEACRACCRAGGLASCEPELHIYGEGSRLSKDGASWRVTGVWDVRCDGTGVFDASGSMVLDHTPSGGELLASVVSPLQVHCFKQACSLPADTCLSAPDESGNYFLSGCADGLPADASQLERSRPVERYPDGKVVVLDGKPLVVAPVSASATPAVSAYTPPANPGYVPLPVPANTYGASSAPPVATPAPPSTGGADFTTFATSLPADPPETCKPPIEALRGEARKRVDLGDEKRIRKDTTGALQEYRAALSMDVCNAYAWLGIGEIASESARPDLAIRALKNATNILPGHYGAWTLLGKNYEAIKQNSLAFSAYRKATDLKPGLTDAISGLERTRGR